jgi:HEAT repeat protein
LPVITVPHVYNASIPFKVLRCLMRSIRGYVGANRPEELPDHLPPVEPPSAGFIVQLFLVPAIIVAVVIGVYLLFGQMAAGETDWRQLVSDIKSDNPNVRWRAALNLAEALDAEASRREPSNELASNPEIATALNDLAVELLKSRSRQEEQQQQLQFMLKAIGRMDAAEQVWPALREALGPSQETETRKQALQAAAMMAGRQRERQKVLEVPGLADAVIDASFDPEAVLRLHAAFTLGLLPGPAADARLSTLLEDHDEKTRVNAAIAFAREGSPRGLSVFRQALRDSEEWAKLPLDQQGGDHGFERQLILKNTLNAISVLAPRLTAGDRDELDRLLQSLEESLGDSALRLQVKAARLELEMAEGHA